MIHDYKLRFYHNPERVDESNVPDGWRFRYADEFKVGPAFTGCRLWLRGYNKFCPFRAYRGVIRKRTYIVPVTP